MKAAADPTFTHDWSVTRTHWPEMFQPLIAFNRRLRVLEIGCYEGQSAMEFVRILDDVIVYCVDPFDDDPGQHDRFTENTRAATGRVFGLPGRSQDFIPTQPWAGLFDLVYVDGSHAAHDVLSDAITAHHVARPSGWILFDDYNQDAMPGVYQAVNAFIACYTALLGDRRPVGADQYLAVKT